MDGNNSTTQCHSRVNTLCRSIVWKIDNFLMHVEQELQSVEFGWPEDNTVKWKLKINPNAGVEKESVSLFLTAIFTEPMTEIRARAAFKILDADDYWQHWGGSKIDHLFTTETPCWGFFKFCESEELTTYLLPNGHLTMRCDLLLLSQINETTVEIGLPALGDNVIENKLAESVGSLLYGSNTLSDVTLDSMRCRKFKVHRNVLSARSRVFATLFKNDKRDVIDIEDVWPDVMEAMLEFMYTGRTPSHIFLLFAERLLVAAHKYELHPLKVVAQEALCSKLSPENVMRLLVLAQENEADLLIDSANRFVAANTTSVMNSRHWERVMDSSSSPSSVMGGSLSPSIVMGGSLSPSTDMGGSLSPSTVMDGNSSPGDIWITSDSE